MNGNLQNGGLIYQSGEQLLLTDIKNYTGTHIIHTGTVPSELPGTSSLMWFMSAEGNLLYYSDQKKGHFLQRMDLDSRKEELILEEPCYQPLLHGEWIYYIHENDQRLYRCSRNGTHNMNLMDEQVNSFLIADEHILYATPRGIKRSNLSGAGQEEISACITPALLQVDNKLAFTDKEKNHVLTLLDLQTRAVVTLDSIAAASLNTDGRYIYCANRLSSHGLYRVDPLHGSSIRICGDRVDYLHVLDHEIYFCNQREWHRLSLLGGEAEKIMFTGRYSYE